MGEVHLGAGTIIQDESGRILLVQEGKEHVKGQYNIPSGGYDGDETIREAAKREAREETGLEVELEGVIGIYTRDAERTPDFKYVMIVFEATKIDGTLKSGHQDEILDVKYFEPEEIKDLELRFNFQNVIKDLQDRGSKELPIHHYDIREGGKMKLKLLDKEDWSRKKVGESIREMISENQLLSMATAKGEEPHINTAFYAFDDELSLYILTPPDTIHGENLEENNSVAVDIHDSHQEWTDDKEGLQIFGETKQVENASKALELYKGRYPELGEFAANTEELEELDSEFYIIKPERIKVFDEPRFGTETWINVKIE